MAALSNPRHESFAQGIAAGLSQREAYTRAGYSAAAASADVNAHRLLSDPKVSARVAEIQERAAAGVETTVSTILAKLWAIANDAAKAEDFGAASISMERIAKVAGLWVEKSQSQANVTQRVVSDHSMSEDEWRSRHHPEQPGLN